MRAVPIEDTEVTPGMKHFIMGAPDGDLTGENGIGALDVVYFRDAEDGTPYHFSKWLPDAEELALIAAGAPIWLAVLAPLGAHPPVSIGMHLPEVEAPS